MWSDPGKVKTTTRIWCTNVLLLTRLCSFLCSFIYITHPMWNSSWALSCCGNYKDAGDKKRKKQNKTWNLPSRSLWFGEKEKSKPYNVKHSMHAQPCLTLCSPMDWSLPGSSVHAIFQARILEWGVISSSRWPSKLRDQTIVSCISYTGRHVLYH